MLIQINTMVVATKEKAVLAREASFTDGWAAGYVAGLTKTLNHSVQREADLKEFESSPLLEEVI